MIFVSVVDEPSDVPPASDSIAIAVFYWGEHVVPLQMKRVPCPLFPAEVCPLTVPSRPVATMQPGLRWHADTTAPCGAGWPLFSAEAGGDARAIRAAPVAANAMRYVAAIFVMVRLLFKD
jgi:hypothetical protein